MASTIKLKNGSGAPTSGQLVQGEPAFDLTNKRLYTENASGTVIEVGTNPSSLTTASADINGGTIDGTVIGATTPAAGTFTSITGTSANINGTVTADGLKVETSTTAAVTISDDTGSGTAELRFVATETFPKTKIVTDVSAGSLTLETLGSDRLSIANNGDISFYDTSGSNAKFFWDASAESLGIGTTSPNIAGFNSCLTIDGADSGLELSSGGTVYATLAANAQGANLQGVGTSGIRMFTAASGSATERMRIDSSGNVGIGRAPNDWSTVTNVLQMKDQYAVSEHAGTGYLSQNWYYNAGEKYIGNGYAIRQFMSSVDGSWGVSRATNNSSGAGAALTWQESMRIDSVGNVGIGRTTMDERLHIQNGNDAINFKASNASGGYATFGLDSAATSDGRITWTNALIFGASGTERMRIDSSGNLLVGKTSANYTTAGFEVGGSGAAAITRSSDQPLALNRLTNDGAIVGFYKDGTTVGSIGSSSGDIYIGTGDTGLLFDDANDTVQPANTTTGSSRDAALILGGPFSRFKDLYLSGGVYLGGTGAANKLDDYETGTFTPTLVGAGTPTYGLRDGSYVKIGDMVFVTLKMTASTITQSSNTITIGGLPFAGGNVGDDDQRSSGIVEGDWQNMGSYVDVARFRLDTGSTLQGVRDNGSGSAIYWSYNDIGTSIEFNTSLSYKV